MASNENNQTAEPPRVIPQFLRTVVGRWVESLVDLTGNNRLLFYKGGAGTLDLSGPHIDAASIERLSLGESVRLSEAISDSEHFAAACRQAKAAAKKAKENNDDRNIDTLYLTRGLASWQNDLGTATPKAPVVIQPVNIEAINKGNDYVLVGDGPWEISPTFVFYMKEKFGIDIDAEAINELFIEDGVELKDFPDAFSAVEAAVATNTLLKDFSIDDNSFVGNFSYAKLPMVTDLQQCLDEGLVGDHELVSALAGDNEALRTVVDRLPEIHEPDLDRLPPENEFLVIDANASQQSAITSVLGGGDLVIQGPPGTGKSQTIANLIASLAAEGKTALFVAEKRAAVDAVRDRLADKGLADLMLDLHGVARARGVVAQSLGRSLDTLRNTPAAPDPSLRALKSSHDRMAEVSEQISTKHDPWNLSYYDAVAQTFGTPEAVRTSHSKPLLELSSLTPDEFEDRCDDLGTFVQLEGARLAAGASVWSAAFSEHRVASIESVITIEELLRNVIEASMTLSARLAQACAKYGLSAPTNPAQFNDFKTFVGACNSLTAEFKDVSALADASRLIEGLGPLRKGGVKAIMASLFSAGYRHAKHDAKALFVQPPTNAAIVARLENAVTLLGRWRSVATLSHALPCVELAQLESAFDLHAKLTSELHQHLGQQTIQPEAPFETVRTNSTQLLEAVGDLRRLPDLENISQRLSAAGLTDVMNEIAERDLDSDSAVAMARFTFFNSVARTIEARFTGRELMTSSVLGEVTARYIQSDHSHIDSGPARVMRKVAERSAGVRTKYPEQVAVIEGEARKQKRHWKVAKLFEHSQDVALSLRPCWVMSPLVVAQLLPRRKAFDVVIFDEASQVVPSDAIGAILRGNRTVVAGDSKQLPPTSFFSGLSTNDSLSEDDSTTVEDVESILDAVESVLPWNGRKVLNVHYRSEDERLINFSNAQPSLYDWGLDTFSNARVWDTLTHVRVANVADEDDYKNGSGRGEVATVARLVRDHGQSHPDESLGVIAMGSNHANNIDVAIDALAAEDETLRDFVESDRFFVKNLERVQGDERDAIILSVGYGSRTATGGLAKTFGPLNNKGGERRFNVAVTRAKRRLTLVSTFDGSELSETENMAEGQRLLSRYIRYVEKGGNDLGAQRRDHPPLNPFELDVKHRLEAAGVPLVPQLGASRFRIDFAAQHPQHKDVFLLAIECDGASYHARPTVRERDRLRQELLERLRWKFVRLWSTDYFRDPQHEIDRVLAEWQAAIRKYDSGDLSSAAIVSPSPVSSASQPPSRNGLRPVEPVPEKPISSYSDKDLYALAKWILSDGLVRSVDELTGAIFDELGAQRRTSASKTRLNDISARCVTAS